MYQIALWAQTYSREQRIAGLPSRSHDRPLRKENPTDQFCSEMQSVFMVRKDTLEGLGDATNPAHVKLWVLRPALQKFGIVVHTYNPNTVEVEPGESKMKATSSMYRVPGLPRLMRPHLKEKPETNKME